MSLALHIRLLYAKYCPIAVLLIEAWMKLLLCSATMHFADPCYLFLSWKELI